MYDTLKLHFMRLCGVVSVVHCSQVVSYSIVVQYYMYTVCNRLVSSDRQCFCSKLLSFIHFSILLIRGVL